MTFNNKLTNNWKIDYPIYLFRQDFFNSINKFNSIMIIINEYSLQNQTELKNIFKVIPVKTYQTLNCKVVKTCVLNLIVVYWSCIINISKKNRGEREKYNKDVIVLILFFWSPVLTCTCTYDTAINNQTTVMQWT